ncbi:hypothetical protein [Paenibacillus gorillae]|uniref:hypothetical protein n=1 Tax=Paenibacillus gorillae TaxID=1243662 RepID=UPI0004B24988|nr:hypothetical protein [Paenibacillus gorillae]
MSLAFSQRKQWLLRPINIKWNIKLGLRTNNRSILSGSYNTNLSYLDDQGDKWGETYIKYIGQHFEDYAHWGSIYTYAPLEGRLSRKPGTFSIREYKDAASGVTGTIGEVLAITFFQNVFGLTAFEMAHLKSSSLYQAPDFCLDIQPSQLVAFLTRHRFTDLTLHNALTGLHWGDPLPLETKSRRQNNSGGKNPSQIKDGLAQLISYWKRVPSVSGYGLIMQVDVFPRTVLNLHLLIPKKNEINNIMSIINGSGTLFPDVITIKEFERIFGGRYV